MQTTNEIEMNARNMMMRRSIGATVECVRFGCLDMDSTDVGTPTVIYGRSLESLAMQHDPHYRCAVEAECEADATEVREDFDRRYVSEREYIGPLG